MKAILFVVFTLLIVSVLGQDATSSSSGSTEGDSGEFIIGYPTVSSTASVTLDTTQTPTTFFHLLAEGGKNGGVRAVPFFGAEVGDGVVVEATTFDVYLHVPLGFPSTCSLNIGAYLYATNISVESSNDLVSLNANIGLLGTSPSIQLTTPGWATFEVDGIFVGNGPEASVPQNEVDLFWITCDNTRVAWGTDGGSASDAGATVKIVPSATTEGLWHVKSTGADDVFFGFFGLIA